MIGEERKLLNLSFHTICLIEFVRTGEYMKIFICYMFAVLSLCGCAHKAVYYIDEEQHGTFIAKDDSKLKDSLSCWISLFYLHNDYISWSSEDNDSYNKAIMNKMTYVINCTLNNGFRIKDLKYTLKNVDTGEFYTEEGIYYDEKYPLEKYDNVNDFLKAGKYSDNFAIEVYYEEEKLKSLENAEIEIESVFTNGKENSKIYFKKKIRRETSVLIGDTVIGDKRKY